MGGRKGEGEDGREDMKEKSEERREKREEGGWGELVWRRTEGGWPRDGGVVRAVGGGVWRLPEECAERVMAGEVAVEGVGGAR